MLVGSTRVVENVSSWFLYCRLGPHWLDTAVPFPSPLGRPLGGFQLRLVQAQHMTLCGLGPLFLLGKYLGVELLVLCMVCLPINSQPHCFLPVLHSHQQ